MSKLSDMFPEGLEPLEFIKEAFELGKSATEALETISNAGMSVSSDMISQVYSYLSGPLNIGREYAQNLGLESIPVVNKLATSLTDLTRNFSYLIEFKSEPSDTGESESRYITVSTNTLLTKQEALDTAVSLAGKYPSTFTPTAEVGNVVDILQNSAGLL